MNEEREATYYALIPSNVRYDKDLSANAKLLYGEITALTNKSGCCWASNNYFCELYKVSKSTISRWLKQLKDKGYINIKLFYKEDSKEIEKRIISIPTCNFNGILRENVEDDLYAKMQVPYTQKDQDPIRKNATENNTSINIILEYFLRTNVFSKVNKLTDSRRKKLLLRIEEQGEENIKKAIDIAANSAFLTGKNDRNWKMDFDWLIANDTNIVKILEGKYSNKQETKKESVEDMYGSFIN